MLTARCVYGLSLVRSHAFPVILQYLLQSTTRRLTHRFDFTRETTVACLRVVCVCLSKPQPLQVNAPVLSLVSLDADATPLEGLAGFASSGVAFHDGGDSGGGGSAGGVPDAAGLCSPAPCTAALLTPQDTMQLMAWLWRELSWHCQGVLARIHPSAPSPSADDAEVWQGSTSAKAAATAKKRSRSHDFGNGGAADGHAHTNGSAALSPGPHAAQRERELAAEEAELGMRIVQVGFPPCLPFRAPA